MPCPAPCGLKPSETLPDTSPMPERSPKRFQVCLHPNLLDGRCPSSVRPVPALVLTLRLAATFLLLSPASPQALCPSRQIPAIC